MDIKLTLNLSNNMQVTLAMPLNEIFHLNTTLNNAFGTTPPTERKVQKRCASCGCSFDVKQKYHYVRFCWSCWDSRSSR